MSITDTTLLDFTGLSGQWDGPCEIVRCGRALSPSGLPDMQYALNPYGGCEHGCIYCYAPKTTHTDPSVWRVVRIKSNIVERLAKELPSVEGIIGIGTVTDPYQGAERKFMLTRRCLELLLEKERTIHMHTKSDLIIRDIDLLAEIKGITGITITGLNDKVSKITEPGAPLPEKRLVALRTLVDAGVNCYALIAPVMSTVKGSEQELMEAIAATGVRKVYYGELHTRHYDSPRMNRLGIVPSPESEMLIRDVGRDLGIDIHDVFRG